MRILLFVLLWLSGGCAGSQGPANITPGADQPNAYLPLLKDKSVAVVANPTSRVGQQHLVDFLQRKGINVQRIFAPEHGFRGDADAGEHVTSGVDKRTGIEVQSLYGKNKKPTREQLAGLDMLVFDIQDVGLRFYTYLSTLHYVMEACAENDISLVVLDRPNPNIAWVDGPVLEPEFQSFVGMHPIPVMHGMTLGELALMINGEGWLNDGDSCNLEVIPVAHYHRSDFYTLPVPPSPNLPNAQAITLYGSLCFFEGTPVSAGRGTDYPFQLFGAPQYKGHYDFVFTPIPNAGSKSPKFNGETCYGMDLRQVERQALDGIELAWLIDAYTHFPDKAGFFMPFFDLLAGTDELRQQLQAGWGAERIKASWEPGITGFKRRRGPYLLYDE